MKPLLVAALLVAGIAGSALLLRGWPGAAADAEPTSSARITSISQGETVDLTEHLVEGAWTVVEFGAVW